MNQNSVVSHEPSEAFWTGQQRFRYLVSAALLPLAAIYCAYCGYKMPARIAPFGEVGYTISMLTSWRAEVYGIALIVQLWTSAAMIQFCASSKMIVPRFVHATARFAAVMWALFAVVLVFKLGILSIAAAIVAATLLAVFALLGAVLTPPEVEPGKAARSGSRFSILQVMFLTTAVAVAVGATIGLQSPVASTNSLGWWVVRQYAVGLFELYLLACPILACYAYYRASVDFRS